ncbi:type 4a pilus biogenesis protein PilO [Vibrio marisflavi]|uniref:MSHA biogenesis protein MshJ n=1 Tax=Vibrio marisflavi CECT 7928 TaxID=634439 RepID=A0ABM9A8G0_9VIBR|nr:type 4a pilus biogenesis protein PilO [Vibrio marisflavi]CAH0541585.1 hypothetical protein VMF7928_03648 [Vibrio marisflavi CECT 7928]
MIQYWQSVSEKFSQMTHREKLLVGFCGLVGVSLLLFSIILEPAIELKQASDKKVLVAEKKIKSLNKDIRFAKAKLKGDPNQDINTELKRLLKQSQQLSLQLSKIIENLISPTQMAQLLEKVLRDTKGVNLVSMESLKAEPITKDKESSQYTGYYLHPIRLEVTGNYFSILSYLQALEALPVKYYWRSFQYTVEEYPTARLVIQVYTLGTRQEFIGG